MPRTKTAPQMAIPDALENGTAREILTLPEAAAYVRLPTDDVLRMVGEQGLPARQVGAEWRFFRTAIQQWLSQPCGKDKPVGLWSAAGSWQNDPYLDDLLKEVYRRRGRPMTEEN
jgi:excisionase family DNA binding protein